MKCEGFDLPFLDKIQRWITEPPPEHLLELSEQGVAVGSTRNPSQRKLEALDEKSLTPSPSTPNVVRPQAFRDALSRYLAQSPGRGNATALVIPDYAVRMAVLDFEAFPSGEAERLALLRFRLRKSVPFHIEEANLAYSIQVQEAKRIEVLAVAIARPILSEYEVLLTDVGLRVGLVMPSCVAALPLYPKLEIGLTLVAKMAGTIASVLLLQRQRVRLARCLDLVAGDVGVERVSEESVLDLIQQTVAFAEDQIGERVTQLALCGFGAEADTVGQLAEREFNVPYVVVRSRLGVAMPENAGFLGLLEQYAA